MNWLRYLLEVNLYLGVFYLCYCLFLNKETHYTLNRFYLLFSCVVSLLLPLIQIGILRPAEPTVQNTFVVIAGNVHPNTIPAQIAPAVSHFNLQDSLLYIYLLGFIILLVILALKLYQLLKLTSAKSAVTRDGYKLIHINDSNTAFSFFNYLFIGTNAPGAETIIRHELVHIRQKHSFDIVLLEIFKVINWFNPLVYLLQNSLKTVHEYIADEKTASFETDAVTYSAFLVNNAYGIGGSSIAHSFFNYNLLKKRIIMLNQKRSGSLARLKYLIALPVCAGLLCASTLSFSKTYGWVDLAPVHKLMATPVSSSHIKTDTSKNKADIVNTTKKGYKYKETKYLIRNKANYRVIITEKNGEEKSWFRNSATWPQIKLLKAKYGYTFPSMDIHQVKFPPPTIHVKITNIALSPPPPQNPFDSLYRYIRTVIRYPRSARLNHIAGREIVSFNIIDSKIDNLKIARGIDADIDAEVLSVIKKFNAPINARPADYYVIPISFALQDINGNMVGNSPKITNVNVANKRTEISVAKTAKDTTSYMLNEIVIVAYEIKQ
ncbi:MAG TPA: M56 family metallopeptidase [Mucilaginibacter sp.]